LVFGWPGRSATVTSPRRRKASRKVLIFGEDETDTKLLSELLLALCPVLDGIVYPFRRPPVLIRDAAASVIPDRVSRLTALIDAEMATSDVICVFAHEDCDAVEPAHETLSQKIEESFRQAGYHVHAVTPAWESEAWLFLWPEAVRAYRPNWRSLRRYEGRNVGLIADAKGELTRALRPQGQRRGRVRDYRETDAPEIAWHVRDLNLAETPRARSASYEQFRARVTECCTRVTSKT
jgi:hypothetical protein